MDIEQIWAQFGEQLHRFIATRVADHDCADELTQQLLIKSYQNLHTLKDQQHIAAWLFRIARNVINDHYRKSGQEQTQPIEEMESLLHSLEQPHQDTPAYETLGQCIQPFIDQLPEKYRQILTAIELEGRSQKALAKEMGIPYSTVKSRAQRGRSQLRKLFDQCCHFDIDVRGSVMGYQPKSGPCCTNCLHSE